MNSKTLLEHEPHAGNLTRQLDQVCDRFESAWKLAVAAGARPPRLEEYLRSTPEPQSTALRRELEELVAAYRPLYHKSRNLLSPADSSGLGKTAAPYSTGFQIPAAPTDPEPTLYLGPVSGTKSGSTSRAGKAPLASGGLRTGEPIRCPHCHHPLDLTENGAEEVLCPACGSSFLICDDSRGHQSHNGGTYPLAARFLGVAAPSAGRPTLAPSRLLGKFKLLKWVGSGACGEVWQAFDTELGRTVALKIPHASLASEPQQLERFYREPRAAAQLRHPGIVTVHEVVKLDGFPVIVSDFIDGVPLRRLLADRRLTFKEAAELIAQVADALDYAHSMRLVHRDIKPGNIMVSSVVTGPLSVAKDKKAQGGDHGPRTTPPAPRPTDHGPPMIMDFGLALRDEAEITMTMDGHIVGTPAYMSPEQALGQGHQADRRSDVYSLGVILYEMLAGELPFRGSKKHILEQVGREEPRPPRKINDKIPRDLETITLKAMEKSPSRRYATARDVADDLRSFLRGEPIKARPVGRIERFVRWSRRNPGLATAAAVIILTTMGVFVSGAVAVERSRAHDSIAKQKEEADKQRGLAEKNHREAQRLSTQMILHRGRTLAEDGDVAEGMLSLARALEMDKGANPDLERVIRVNLAAFYPRLTPLKEVIPQSSSMLAVAFSSDGKLFATGCQDGLIQVFETANYKPIQKILGHEGPVLALAFSPDAKILMTGSEDKTARLWEVSTGKTVGTPLKHEGSVLAVAFGHDGRSVLTGNSDTGVDVWDINKRQSVGSIEVKHSPVINVAFSSDAKTVLINRNNGAQLWDIDSKKEIGIPIPHAIGTPLSFALDKNGDTLVIAPRDGEITVWNPKSGKQIGPTFPKQPGLISLALSPDGKVLLTGHEDKTARLWSMEDGAPIGHSLIHPAPVHAIALSPDGRTILTGSADKAARIWERHLGYSPCTELAHKDKVRAGAYSLDGKKIITGSWDKTAQIWDVASGKPVGPPLQHKGRVLSVAFSSDGKSVLTGSADMTACLWDAQTCQKLFPFPHKGWIWSVAFSPDGKLAATAGSTRDESAHIWNTATGLEVVPKLVHQKAVQSVAFSPNGSQLLTASDDQTANFWDTATGRLQNSLLGHQDTVKAVKFGPDGMRVLTSSYDHTARVWDTITGQQIGQPFIHNDEIWAIAFSPDGRLVLTGSHDNTAHLWSAESGEAIGPSLQHHAKIVSVAFSPDSSIVLTGSDDKTARLWDATTGEPLGPALVHELGVKAVAFNPTGNDFWTGSDDFNGRIWKAPIPVDGNEKRILLWIQLITGMEQESGEGLRPLDALAWKDRRLRLEELGGPPKY